MAHTIAISKSKATCLAVLEKVRKTGQPVLVTRFGEPVAEVVPSSLPPRPEEWLGSFRKRGRILGDIRSPPPERVKADGDRVVVVTLSSVERTASYLRAAEIPADEILRIDGLDFSTLGVKVLPGTVLIDEQRDTAIVWSGVLNDWDSSKILRSVRRSR